MSFVVSFFLCFYFNAVLRWSWSHCRCAYEPRSSDEQEEWRNQCNGKHNNTKLRNKNDINNLPNRTFLLNKYIFMRGYALFGLVGRKKKKTNLNAAWTILNIVKNRPILVLFSSFLILKRIYFHFIYIWVIIFYGNISIHWFKSNFFFLWIFFCRGLRCLFRLISFLHFSQHHKRNELSQWHQ